MAIIPGFPERGGSINAYGHARKATPAFTRSERERNATTCLPHLSRARGFGLASGHAPFWVALGNGFATTPRWRPACWAEPFTRIGGVRKIKAVSGGREGVEAAK